jgi:hypothetical protein
MKYYIRRDLNEYGPYTLADLQRYVAQGNISPTDLTRSEGMTDWVPVSQVIGNVPAPAPPPAMTAPAPVQEGTVYSGTPVAAPAGAAYGVAAAPAVAGPVPPDFQWPLVLLIGFVTCGIFSLVWLFIEAAFVKKIRPASIHLKLYITALIVQFGSMIVFYGVIFALAAASAARGSNQPPNAAIGLVAVLYWVGLLGAWVLNIIANFKMRDAMVEYYNTVEPINLRLSGVMTFFFNILYFQYHFSRIAAWKKTGYLVPQVYQG